MKQVFIQIKKNILMSCLALATSFMFFGCTKSDVSVSLMYSISGNANSSQVTPAPTTNNSNGSGTMSGSYNSSTKVMTYTSTWASLTGAPIAGAFYSGASAGAVGSLVGTWSLGSGLTASGSFSGSVTLNADQETQLLAGKCYYVFSTTANVSGEIRGQIKASAQ